MLIFLCMCTVFVFSSLYLYLIIFGLFNCGKLKFIDFVNQCSVCYQSGNANPCSCYFEWLLCMASEVGRMSGSLMLCSACRAEECFHWQAQIDPMLSFCTQILEEASTSPSGHWRYRMAMWHNFSCLQFKQPFSELSWKCFQVCVVVDQSLVDAYLTSSAAVEFFNTTEHLVDNGVQQKKFCLFYVDQQNQRIHVKNRS